MSAELESGFFYKEPAWHGLGKVTENVLTAEEAIKAADLDWTVEKRPIFTDKQAEIKDAFATMRDTDDKVLGIVGRQYTPLQNKEAFGFFDNVVSEGTAMYHTAGSLHGGRRVWILAKLPNHIEVSDVDIVEKYVLLSNRHDGIGSVIGGFTPIRVVCQNTLNAALGSLQNTVRVRHTTNIATRIKEAYTVMKIVNKNYEAIEKAFKGLAIKSIDTKKLDSYLTKVFPATDKKKKVSTRVLNTRTRVKDLFDGKGKGSELPTSRGTAWGAYNAVCEYFDYDKKYKSQGHRLGSVWFGREKGQKEKALDLALNL